MKVLDRGNEACIHNRMLFIPREKREPGVPAVYCCLDEPGGYSAKESKFGHRKANNVLIRVESINVDLLRCRG